MDYEPTPQDIGFIQALIASPKNVWGIPRSGNPDDPQSCTTYYINREQKTFYRLITGIKEEHPDHEITTAILEKIGWTMSERHEIEPNLDHAVNALAMQMIIGGKVAPAVVNDLVSKLKGEIAWKQAPIPGTAQAWTAVMGDWIFNLVQFDISDQPGHKEGDRGHNITMTHPKTSLVMMSDSAMFHDIAKFLTLKQSIKEAVIDRLGFDVGLGKTDAPTQTFKRYRQ